MNESDEQFGPLQELWHSQKTAPIETDLSRLRTEAESLDTSVRKRNRRETLIAVLLAGYFLLVAGAEAVAENTVSAGGALLVSVSMLWVRYAIQRWGRSGLAPEDLRMDGQSFLTVYLRELVRQRRLVLHAWLWYVLPIGAGLLILSLGGALHRRVPVETWLGSIMFLGTTALAIVVVLLNLAAARILTRRIVELRSVEEI